MNTWLLCLGLALPASQADSSIDAGEDAPLSPRAEAARFVIAAREVAPIAVDVGARVAHRVGPRDLRIGADRWSVVDPTQPTASRERYVTPPPGEFLWLSSAGDVAFFATAGNGASAAVLRLDVAQARWLEPWPWRTEPGESAESWEVCGLTTDATGVFVLAHKYTVQQTTPVLSEVRRVDPNSGATLWSRTVAESKATDGPGALLLAPMRNAPLAAAPPSMAVAGAELIVCPPGAETIARFTIVDGAPLTPIERPWEFERVFVGPSVWQHHIGRLGMQQFVGEPDADELAQKRAAFDAHTKGVIVAGPYIELGNSDEHEPRWWVICARMPSDDFGNQVAQQFVCEFDARGEPLSIVALPRPIMGPAVELDGGTWMFACARGAAVAVARSDWDRSSRLGASFPGSGFDCIGRVAWFSDAPVPAHQPWLASDATSDLIAVSRRLAISSLGGGEIERPNARKMEFPFRFIDPRDGRARHARLVVPFDGQPKLPSTNYRRDEFTTWVWGSLDFAVTRVDFVGERLELTLASRATTWTLVFELDSLLEPV